MSDLTDHLLNLSANPSRWYELTSDALREAAARIKELEARYEKTEDGDALPH